MNQCRGRALCSNEPSAGVNNASNGALESASDHRATPVSLGTTIMACVYRDGVILGADSRTSTGSYVANRVTDKLTRLTDRIYVCRSGSAADTQNLSMYVVWFLEQHAMELGEEPDVLTAAKLLAKLAYENKSALQAGLIVAGWDEKRGGQVYSIPLGGTMVETKLAIGGSGSAYITSLTDATYRDDMTEDECRAWVQRSVSHAAARDASSGGCVRTVAIRKEGVNRHFLEGDRLPFMLC